MPIFSELRNECLIRELCRELNTDVLLFGFDGFTYFGRLQGIEDGRVALLSAAVEADTSDVEILTPGGELQTTKFLWVDLWQVVAKGTGIVNDPIANSVDAVLQTATEPERQESRDLICQLRRMVGDCVTLTTLGGFLFEGILGAVDDDLAIITVEDIFVPGTSSSISDDDVRTAVINLNALTSVSSTASCS